MKMTIGRIDFVEAFCKMGQLDKFSSEGLLAFYDYLEDIHGGEYELDVLELCNGHSEYTLVEYNEEYGEDYADVEDIKFFHNGLVIIVGDETVIVSDCSY